MTEISIIGAKDEVDAEETLIKVFGKVNSFSFFCIKKQNNLNNK